MEKNPLIEDENQEASMQKILINKQKEHLIGSLYDSTDEKRPTQKERDAFFSLSNSSSNRARQHLSAEERGPTPVSTNSSSAPSPSPR